MHETSPELRVSQMPATPTLPAASPRQAFGLGAGLFAAGALLTLVATVAPGSSKVDLTGSWIVTGCAAAFALVLWFGRERLPSWMLHVGISLGVLLITAGIYINGERDGGPAALNEVYYVWPVIFAAYYFPTRALVLQLAFVSLCYAAVLVAVDPGPIAITRWLIVMTMLAGVGGLVNLLRIRVDQLVARLTDAARSDSLTGLLNRRGFDERFEAELARAQRWTRPLALVLSDVDHFKTVNDRFGHPAGDAALLRIAETLGSVGRRSDTVARLGGEEFVFVLPDTDARRALELAERARTTIEHAFAEQPIPLTASFGIVSFPEDGTTAAALLTAADRALYAAKRGGRNRTDRPPSAE